MDGQKKLIIDTDPGVDDAMAILAAFNSPELEVIGLTTLYGNVPTELATENALRLVEMAGRQDCPVVQGSLTTLAGGEKKRIADFVHGNDGFGNSFLPKPRGAAVDKTAAEFIVEMVNGHPGQVSILALASMTNVALALQLDPSIGAKWRELVVLGGAFFVNGNVNPAAEANIFGDPEAADFVFGASANIKVIGLDITHRCHMTGAELDGLREAGAHGKFVHQISQFYLQYHQKAYGGDSIYLHDPAALVVCLRPELFSWRRGAVRVATEGVARGHTIMDAGLKNWVGHNPWLERPQIEVALGVAADEVRALVKERLSC